MEFYGLAVGAVGDVRCAFAWQWLDDVRGKDAGFMAKPRPASIRLRLCRRGVTADDLAAWFDGLQMAEAATLDAVFAAWKDAPESALIGDKGSPADSREGVIMNSASLESEIVGPALRPVTTSPVKLASVPRRPRQIARARKEEAAPAAAYREPTTPAPRRFLAPTEVAARAPQVSPTPAGSPTARAITPPQLDATLPPEAYRGPSAAALAPVSQLTPQRYLSAVTTKAQ